MVLKVVIAGVVEEDERPLPIKYSNSMRNLQPLTTEVQLLAFPWQNCLELIGEGAKGGLLAPSNN